MSQIQYARSACDDGLKFVFKSVCKIPEACDQPETCQKKTNTFKTTNYEENPKKHQCQSAKDSKPWASENPKRRLFNCRPAEGLRGAAFQKTEPDPWDLGDLSGQMVRLKNIPNTTPRSPGLCFLFLRVWSIFRYTHQNHLLSHPWIPPPWSLNPFVPLRILRNKVAADLREFCFFSSLVCR